MQISLQFEEDIQAWVSMDGHARQVYAVERPNTNAQTCWIASEPGKKFSVNWRSLSRQYPLQGTVFIDGVACDNHIMLDAGSYPNRPNAVGVSYARTSDFTRRDFMFTAIEVTDDDDYLHTVDQAYSFGTITLQLWRLQVDYVVTKSLEHQPGNPVLESQVVHERSKKAGTHHVKYGEEYYSPAPVVDVVSAKTIGVAPYASFTFKYRPIAMLMAGGIVPRPAPNPPTPSLTPVTYPAVDSAREAEIRALEAKIALLRRPRALSTTYPTDQAPSSSTSTNHTRSPVRVKTEPRVYGIQKHARKMSTSGSGKRVTEVIDLTDL